MVVCAKLERKESSLWKHVLFWGSKSNPTVTMESFFLTLPQYQGIWINWILDQNQGLSRVFLQNHFHFSFSCSKNCVKTALKRTMAVEWRVYQRDKGDPAFSLYCLSTKEKSLCPKCFSLNKQWCAGVTLLWQPDSLKSKQYKVFVSRTWSALQMKCDYSHLTDGGLKHTCVHGECFQVLGTNWTQLQNSARGYI